MRYYNIFFFIFLSLLYNQTNACEILSINPIEYKSSRGEQVVMYKVEETLATSATDLACILGTEFLKRVQDFPDKIIIGITSGSSLMLVKWNIKEDFILLIEVTIPAGEYRGTGVFTKYPQPLERIKEIMTNKPFPKKEELSPHLRLKFKQNLVQVSKKTLENLMSGEY